jgi:hypothetical protein
VCIAEEIGGTKLNLNQIEDNQPKKNNMLKKHNYIAGLVASLAFGIALAPMVQAGTEVKSGKDGKSTPMVEATKSYISGDLGVQFVSTYYSRGILQGPQGKAGFDAQPYLDLYFKLYEGTGVVNKVTLNLGLWSNIASDTKPSLGGPVTRGLSSWTEFDWMPGISVTFAKNFTLTVSYFEFDYPAQGSSPQRSINTSLAYDDTDLLGMWALHPHVTFLQELTGNPSGGHVGLGLAGGSKLGQYYEVGIAPSFTFLKDSKYPITFALPVTVGLGSNGFYGTGFGYTSVGGTLSVPLAFVPAGFGSWTASVGGTYYYLGTTTARANGQFSVSGVNHDAGVASAGVGLTF